MSWTFAGMTPARHLDSNGGDEMETRDFGWAIRKLKAGAAVCRDGWNGKGMWLRLQVPDAHSKMGAPYIYMKTAANAETPGYLVPWLASQTDMLAEDWSEATGGF